eukprot:8090013-Heterocapsa_arctica.AAC.1
MIDLTQFDENVSLPSMFYTDNYDMQTIGIVRARAKDVESPSGTPPPEKPASPAAPPTTASKNAKTAHYNYDAEDDNVCESGEDPEY